MRGPWSNDQGKQQVSTPSAPLRRFYVLLSARTFLAEDITVYNELEEDSGIQCTDADEEEGNAGNEAMDRRLISGESSSALVPDVVAATSVVVNGSAQGEWGQRVEGV